MVHPSLIAAVDRYNPVARLLHWTVAVLVLAAWPLGMVIKFVKEDVKLTFYLLHESLGFLILWVMLARLAIRLLIPPPPEPPMPALFVHTARIVHILLYAALLIQPIFGFLATNAFGFPLHWFNLVEVWSPIGKRPDLAPRLLEVHVVLGWAILVLFALHILGVIFHHVIRRDTTLYRMV
jgi:cytochrome b561